MLDDVAESVINFETGKSTALSFAAGLPGGFAMIGTVPADITQFYVHAFRIMQGKNFGGTIAGTVGTVGSSVAGLFKLKRKQSEDKMSQREELYYASRQTLTLFDYGT